MINHEPAIRSALKELDRNGGDSWRPHLRDYGTYGRIPRKLKKRLCRPGAKFTFEAELVTSAPSFQARMVLL